MDTNNLNILTTYITKSVYMSELSFQLSGNLYQELVPYDISLGV